MNPGSVTILLGKETHTSQDEFTFRARRLVPLKALNDTQYRYTSIPGALRTFSTDKDKQSETSVQPHCNKRDPKVKPLLKVKLEPSSKEKSEPMLKQPVEPLLKPHVESLLKQPIEPLLKQPVEPLLKDPVDPLSKQPNEQLSKQQVQPLLTKQTLVQVASRKTQQPKAPTLVPSKNTEPKQPAPTHKVKMKSQPLDWEHMVKDGSAQAIVEKCAARKDLVSRNGQYRKFSNNNNSCQYERLVSDLAYQNQVHFFNICEMP